MENYRDYGWQVVNGVATPMAGDRALCAGVPIVESDELTVRWELPDSQGDDDEVLLYLLNNAVVACIPG